MNTARKEAHCGGNVLASHSRPSDATEWEGRKEETELLRKEKLVIVDNHLFMKLFSRPPIE